MTDNKIAEVRKRHAFAEENKSVIRPSGFSWTIPGWQAHNDRAALLAEVEKLTRERDEARAEVERLRAALRDALDGLRYWVPQTSVGAVEKCRIVEKGIEALEAKP